MANEYYTPSGWPVTSSTGLSQTAKDETALIEAGFDKCPALTIHANEAVFVNTAGTAMVSTTAVAARALLGLAFDSDAQEYSDALQALSNLSPAANTIPRMTSATTADLLAFHDDDTLSSNDALGVASQQSLKAYIAAKESTLSISMPAPTGTDMAFYTASAPLGWTISTGFDSRLMTCHSTTGGTTYGIKAIDAAYSSETVSVGHTHTWSTTNTTNSVVGSCSQVGSVGGPVNLIDCSHNHNHANSGTTDNITTNHTHVASTAQGIYCIVATRD